MPVEELAELSSQFHYEHFDALKTFIETDEEEDAEEAKYRFVRSTASGWSPPGLSG